MDKKSSYECVLCSRDLTKDLGLEEEADYPIYHNQLIKKKKPLVAFLICIDCMTNGIFPDEYDIEYIRKGWNKGGFLWNNYRKATSEVILLGLLFDRVADGRIKIGLNKQKELCLSCEWKGKRLVVNLNELKSRQEKNEEQ